MFFLDDFLELLEPFTTQFQDDISQIGVLDKTVESLQKQMNEKSEEMFKEAQRKRVAGVENVQSDPQIIQLYNEIKALHRKTKGKNELKVRLMSEVIAKVDRYLRRCDSDLENFRNEMEGEHPGITGELEQKALEIDDRSCEPIRKNSSLPQDFEYDEKAFKQAPQMTPVRKKSISQPRARRPSEKETSILTHPLVPPSSSNAILGSPIVHHPPGIQRSASVSAVSSCGLISGIERTRKLSLTTASTSTALPSTLRLTHPNQLTSRTMSPPPNKAIRLDPTFLNVQLTTNHEHYSHSLGVETHHLLLDGQSTSSTTHRPARIKKLTPKGVEYHQTISHKNEAHFRIPPFPEFINGVATTDGTKNALQQLTTAATSSGPSSSYSCVTSNLSSDNGNGELPSGGGVPVSSLLKTVPSTFNCVNLTPAGPTHD